MGIKIISDSTCDISKERAAELGVTILPLTVIFDGIEYIDGVTITPEEFYRKLRASKTLPTTSQVTVGAFLEVFEKAQAEGDEVVGVFVAEEMSGTLQSARIAADTLGWTKIHIVDSRSVTFGLAALVFEAVRLRDMGLTGAQIVLDLEKFRERIKLLAVIDDLTYLQKGGRLSGAGAVLGTMLGIKPIVTVGGGKVQQAGKARGIQRAYEWIAAKIKESDVDASRGLIFGHADSKEQLGLFTEYLCAATGLSCRESLDIGVTVGTHAGPGCVGVVYIIKE